MRITLIASLFLFFFLALPVAAAPGNVLLLEMEEVVPLDTSVTNHNPVSATNFSRNATRAFGTYSGNFDAAVNTLLSVPDHADWFMNQNGGMMGIDFWYKGIGLGPLSGQAQGVFQQYQDESNFVDLRIENPSGGPYLVFQIRSGGLNIIYLPTVSFAYSTSEWTHIAVIRGWGGNANEWAITVNGKRQPLQAPYSYINNISWPDLTGAFEIGRGKDLPYADFGYVNAYIDRFRVTNGEAVWTDEFSPKFTVTTTGESAVTGWGATLNGSIAWNIAEQDSVNYYFDYGDVNYGFLTTGLLTFPIFSSPPVTGLNENTLYHYRAYIVDGAEYYGSDDTFTTSGDSIAPTITITNPASPTFTANTNPITVNAIAADFSAIDTSSAIWSNNNSAETGSCGFAGGIYTCSVRLQNGINNIDILVADVNGNVGSGSIIITLVAGMGASGEISGWAWSEHYGWISLSSSDCDDNPVDGFIDGDCNSSGDPVIPYNVQATNPYGVLRGYAWNDYVGWIAFHRMKVCSGNNSIYCETDAGCGAAGTCTVYDPDPVPDGGYATFNSNCETSSACDDDSDNCTACYTRQENKIYGWAKVLSMGDEGWIRLDDDNPGDTFNYGVTHLSDELHGWAWGADGGAGIGWVSFNSHDCEITPYDNTIDIAACGTVGSAIARYYVAADFNTPPTVTFDNPGNLLGPVCKDPATGVDQPLMEFLRWNFLDADGDTQVAYHIKVYDTNPGGNNVSLIEQYYDQTSAGQYVFNDPNIIWNQTYNYEVQVRDSAGASSTVFFSYHDETGELVRTPRHDYPEAYFTWMPQRFSAGEEVLFKTVSPLTLSYNNSNNPEACPSTVSNKCHYEWFVNGVSVKSGNTDASSTVIAFDQAGEDNVVSLKITDNTPFSCSTSSISVKPTYRLPSWIESY